jgi:chorismate mutase
MAEERDVSARPAAPSAAATSGETPEIDAWRRRIDQIDTQLMGLLNSRSACAVEIGRIKRTLGLPVYSPEREARILERVMRENPGPLDPMAVRRVFERIIDESRRLERLAADSPQHEADERPKDEPPLRASGIDSREHGIATSSAEGAGRNPAASSVEVGRPDHVSDDESRRLERLAAAGAETGADKKERE